MTAPTYGAGKRFEALDGMVGEGFALRKLLRRPTVLQGEAATRERLLALKSPRVLHLATHGEYSIGLSEEEGTFIALAGANLSSDGIVTGRELAGINLNGTHLVTISACESGRGTASFADGLLGLQRALAIAGSRSQLLSLWKIDDLATRDFMQAFYTEVAAGESKAEALRRVQIDFIQRGRPPAEWAAFVLFGDPRPIP